MSLKEKIKTEVAGAIENGKEVKKKITEITKNTYQSILDKSKDGTVHLKEDTKSILSGIQEGFEDAKAKNKDIVLKLKEQGVSQSKSIEDTAHLLVRLTEEKSHQQIKVAKEKSEKAKGYIIEEANAVKGNMDKVKVDTQNKMRESLDKFYQFNKDAKTKLESVSAGIGEFAKEKSKSLKEQTILELHNAKEKSNEARKHFQDAAKEHTKEIVSTSLSKTSDWLTNLSNKIK